MTEPQLTELQKLAVDIYFQLQRIRIKTDEAISQSQQLLREVEQNDKSNL